MSGEQAESIHEAARAQFEALGAEYVASAIHAKGEDLGWLIEQAGPLRGVAALDVATGGGHVALALARAGAQVTACDLSEAMLAAARAEVTAATPEARFEVCPAEALPFAAGAFGLVTCRIAPHHFADPRAFVAEVARVLAPGGRFILIDNIAPADARLARLVNRIEAARDPSHVEAYDLVTWLGWLAEAGLEVEHLRRWSRRKGFADWAARSRMSEAAQAALEAEVLALPELDRAYLEVEAEGGRLIGLAHEVALITARRGAAPSPNPRAA